MAGALPRITITSMSRSRSVVIALVRGNVGNIVGIRSHHERRIVVSANFQLTMHRAVN